MLNIGNKKYRNLQEQVGFNTEQIEKIFETLDGLNVQDNVVVISDLSTPLTAEELEIVSKEVAFIIYSNQLYIKKSEDASNAYFDIVFTISSAGGVVSFTTKEITVTLSNGALGLTTSTENVYSETQTDTLLSTKSNITYVDAQIATCAKLSGASFTGAITGPSITENMSGYSAVVRDSSAKISNEAIYVGACKNGNKLTLVAVCKINKVADATGFAWLFQFTVPQSVADCIVPYSSDLECDAKKLYAVKSNTFVALDAKITKSSLNGTGFYMSLVDVSNLTAGNNYFLRYEATFLLNNSLI